MTVTQPPEGARGPVATWLGVDPVRATGIALILVQLAWRPQIAARGSFAIDDWPLASRAMENHLSSEYLLALFNNHFMPAGVLIGWLVTHATGLAYWPYVLIMTVGQALVDIAFYRLLRDLLRPGWGQLVPLAMFLFSPLTLEATSWWAVGVNMLPMQLAMVLAIGAQVRYVRTRRARHLVTLALSVLLGLVFFEKSLLIVPLLFLLTACLFGTGGPVRSVLRTLVAYWRSWLVLTAISVAFVLLYFTRTKTGSYRPASVGQVLTFLRDLTFQTTIPGLFGGPWRWWGVGDGAPLVLSPDVPRWLALAALVALVVLTIRARRIALRAWVLLLAYFVMVCAVLSTTRLGSGMGGVAGLVPRYMSDVVVVAALCVGVALLGLRDEESEVAELVPAGWPVLRRTRGAVAVALVVALGAYLLSAAWSAARFGDEWQHKQGRDYLATAETDLRGAAGAQFFDARVPDGVVGPLSAPYNLQSRFFLPANLQPTFVTESENPWTFDDSGHMRPIKVEGVSIKPKQGSCGYLLTGGEPTSMPLTGSLFYYVWVVRIGYLASGDSQARLQVGSAEPKFFQVRKGLNQDFFVITASGNSVELTVQDPAVTLCTNEITIGNAVPAL